MASGGSKDMIEIKRWDNEEVIHSGDFDSIKECLEDGVRKGIIFYKANFCKADLRGVDLEEANLEGATLDRADLEGTNLYKANFCKADLRGVDLEEANLYRAEGILQFGPMASSGRLAYAVNFGDHVKIQAGCFWDTTDVLRAKVKNDPKRQDYLLLCDWAEKRFLGEINEK
jgi:hypothetical protein